MAWVINAGELASGESVEWFLSWPAGHNPGLKLLRARAVDIRGGGLIIRTEARIDTLNPATQQRRDGNHTYWATARLRGISSRLEWTGAEID